MRSPVPAICAAIMLQMGAAHAQALAQDDTIVVTGELSESGASVMRSVIGDDELRARGVRDLRGALALVAGVDAPPGGDAGPAGAVPAIWGLQEFDSFLLVVDGVPAGGAFSPAVQTLDFENIERIEVSRGPAAASYGSASIVGVIEVFHHTPGRTPATVSVLAGDRSRWGASGTVDLPLGERAAHSLSGSYITTEFSQNRSDMERLHVLYRLVADTLAGAFGFDLDGTRLRQTPYSPHPVEDEGLSPDLRFDANVNPADARADQDRLQANFRFRRPLGDSLTFLATASYAHTASDSVRGFLVENFDRETPNASGFRQDLDQDDYYLNAKFDWRPNETWSGVLGATWTYGRAEQASDVFAYNAPLDGGIAPAARKIAIDKRTRTLDKRSFATLYGSGNWTPISRLTIDASIRYDLADESRHVEEEELDDGDFGEGDDARRDYRWSGGVGGAFVLKDGNDPITAFARYAETFQPADVDFGPEAEGDILKPEDARSIQGGLRGRAIGGRLDWEASFFETRNNNLVISENVAGLPGRANAGKERFRGFEIEGRYAVSSWLSAAASYAHHDAVFLDYERLSDDGSLQQLAGNSIELAPKTLASLGLIVGEATGWQVSATAHHVSSRFLNKSNTIRTDAYTTLDATLVYRARSWQLQLVGENLTDRRDPVIESELGEDQFYTLPGRQMFLRLTAFY